ncbi:hypothetical protein S245_066705, partial [Arachis hypogaea]
GFRVNSDSWFSILFVYFGSQEIASNCWFTGSVSFSPCINPRPHEENREGEIRVEERDFWSVISVAIRETRWKLGAAAAITFGFKNLMETFTVDVYRAENRPLNVPLIAPFTIASSRLEMVENVAVRIELSNGSVGWGEAPILPFVTAEDQKTAMAKASEACAFLRRCPSLTLGSMLEDIGNSDEFFKVAAPLETLGRAAAELRIMKRTRIGMDLQFDMVEVDAFVKQPDGLLFS